MADSRLARAAASTCAAAVLATVLLLAPAPLAAAGVEAGSNDRTFMQEALKGLPFDKLSPGVQQKVRPVVSAPSIYRRMPQKTFACDPEMHVFLLRNPDVIVNIWQLMGISKVQVQEVAPNRFACVDAAGTEADVELVYGTPEVHVIYSEGTYEGPIFRQKLTGRCVLLLRSVFTRGPGGQIVVTDTLDAFVQIDNLGLDIVARTLAPILGSAADHNFNECAQFVGRVSQAAEANGLAVQRLASRLANVPPAKRDELSTVADHVSQRAAARLTRVENPPTLLPVSPASGTRRE